MLLEGKNLSFKYKNTDYLFENINISVESGEIVGLVAKSGYGKSTLSKILAGYETPTKGQVLLNGKKLPNKGYNPVQLIYQHPEKSINPRMKMRDVLLEAGPIDYDLIKAIGIEEDWLTRYPLELSGGELQRFSVARVLNEKTKFIIADEISTMLDVITQAQIWNVIIEFVNKRNIGLVAVTHNKHLAEKICNRIFYLEKENRG
ncbi:MAG TPA: ATP-binding cassette domain-containing protein [Tissierellia bacterium]|jgi:peptide/nickel transport system ATP-binding protein|nr:ATP-binding cassette domain-containing protein [Tissierellia bacterium]